MDNQPYTNTTFCPFLAKKIQLFIAYRCLPSPRTASMRRHTYDDYAAVPQRTRIDQKYTICLNQIIPNILLIAQILNGTDA